MSVNEVYNLLKKFREKKCSPEELERLNDWYGEFSGEAEHIPGIPSEKLEALWNDIEKRVKSAPDKPRTVRFINWRNVAALLTLSIGIGSYFLLHKPENELQIVRADIQPGKKTAVLKLSDGREIALTDSTVIHEKDGTLIRNEQSADLDYTNIAETAGEILINKISVPLGGEYQLILADGTRVWLNSGTELSYPIVFNGDTRQVELKGEAYFEVTKTGKPFVVKTPDVSVRVLGTKFNISAYADDALTISTLVSGKVGVSARKGGKEYLLQPGNSAFYHSGDAGMEVRQTDADLYTSWIKGEFRFINMPLEDILTKLGRWYNCAVFYQNEEIKHLRFSGAAEKDRSVSYILEMIQTVTDVKFKINGTTIVAYK